MWKVKGNTKCVEICVDLKIPQEKQCLLCFSNIIGWLHVKIKKKKKSSRPPMPVKKCISKQLNAFKQERYSHLCLLRLCCLKACLEVKSFPHILHGIEIPVRWFVSMWLMIEVLSPSLPHTLHILALPRQFPGAGFSLNSNMDFTFLSSSSKPSSVL